MPLKKQDRPYWEETPAQRRALRAEYARKANPEFFKKMRKMSRAQLKAMESELLESEIQRIRLLPGYRSNPELQKKVAQYSYDLRCNQEGEFWRKWVRPRKQIPRYRSKHDPKPEPVAVEPSPPGPLPWSQLTPMPDAPKTETPTVPESDQPSDGLHSKFFHSARHPYDDF